MHSSAGSSRAGSACCPIFTAQLPALCANLPLSSMPLPSFILHANKPLRPQQTGSPRAGAPAGGMEVMDQIAEEGPYATPLGSKKVAGGLLGAGQEVDAAAGYAVNAQPREHAGPHRAAQAMQPRYFDLWLCVSQRMRLPVWRQVASCLPGLPAPAARRAAAAAAAAAAGPAGWAAARISCRGAIGRSDQTVGGSAVRWVRDPCSRCLPEQKAS